MPFILGVRSLPMVWKNAQWSGRSLPARRHPEHAARHLFLQLVSALIYCHARGVSHDVKPQNRILDADGNLKVSDFGLAALPDSLRDDGRLHTACGTPALAALEVLRRKAYDGAKADAWSCSVILAGHLPFDDANIADMCRKAHRREYTVLRWVSNPARRLVARLLDPNPAIRLAIAEVASHPWFKRSLSLDSQLGSLLGGQPERELAFKDPPAPNAFDIISMSPGLDLSRLFGESRRVLEKRFMTTVSPEQTVERLGQAGAKLGYFVVGKKGVDRLNNSADQGNEPVRPCAMMTLNDGIRSMALASLANSCSTCQICQTSSRGPRWRPTWRASSASSGESGIRSKSSLSGDNFVKKTKKMVFKEWLMKKVVKS